MWSSRQPLFSVVMSLCPMILPLVGQKQCVLRGGGMGVCSQRRPKLSSLKLGTPSFPPPTPTPDLPRSKDSAADQWEGGR